MRNRAGSHCNQLCFVTENIYQLLLHLLILLQVTTVKAMVGDVAPSCAPEIRLSTFILLLSAPDTSGVACATEVFQGIPSPIMETASEMNYFIAETAQDKAENPYLRHVYSN